MSDSISPQMRSKIMRAIKSRTKTENVVAKELWKKGFRFRRNVRDLYGKPDIAIKKYKIVIFIDSCFWHFCPLHGHYPKSNVDYWVSKINRNKINDTNVTAHYIKQNWHILRIWEHEINQDFDNVILRIATFISDIKNDCNE